MKILFSGFEPFGEHRHNPSQEALEDLSKSYETILLPVSFKRAFERLKQKIEKVQPDYVIALGLAEKRDDISLERIAINLIDARFPDNDGNQPRETSVIEDAPDGLFSNLPLKEMMNASLKEGIPTKISDSAGTYVCNDLMFKLNDLGRRMNIKTGFIHLPLEEKVSKDQVLTSLKAMIKTLQ